MEKIIEFVNESKSGAYSIADLARQFNISRPTAYKYIKRYKKNGIKGLEELSRAHSRHPAKIPQEIEDKIVYHRKIHPRWGGEKIWKLLFKDFQAHANPSISTVNRVLKRNNLIIRKKRRRRVKPVHPIFSRIMRSGVLILKENSDLVTSYTATPLL